MTELDPQDRPEKTIGVLVLGLGNVLLADDGLGAAVIGRLERDYQIPPGVHLVDGGTLGLSLLGLIAEAQHAIIVDAVRADNRPGTLIRLVGEDVADAVRDRLSPHQVGVADLLDTARLIDRYPSTVTLLGLVPESFDLTLSRSNAVESGLDELVNAVVREVQSLGYTLATGPEDAGQCRPVHNLARYFGM